jgi:hypothetical protein
MLGMDFYSMNIGTNYCGLRWYHQTTKFSIFHHEMHMQLA